MSDVSLLGSYGGAGGSSLSFRNKIINGNFDIWQRGTSLSSTDWGKFLADRWYASITATNANYTYERTTDVPNSRFAYSAKITQNSGFNASSLTEYHIRQVIERQNTLALSGGFITASFWYKSNVTGKHAIRTVAFEGYPGANYNPQEFDVNQADTWEYKTVTFNTLLGVTSITGDMSNAGMVLDVGFKVGDFGGGQTVVNENSYFCITGVQLEEGPVASTFEQRPIGMELQLCQRYYQRRLQQMEVVTPYSTEAVSFRIPLSTTMRVTPTVSQISGTSLTGCLEKIGSGVYTPTSVPILVGASEKTIHVDFNGSFTLGQPIVILADIIEASAEL